MRAVAFFAAVVSGALVMSGAGGALAQDYNAILAAPDRSDADRQNDGKRQAAQFLPFIGARTGMKVLDMGAGAGYSSELLARSVGETGKVYAQNINKSEKLDARMQTPAMRNSTALARPYEDPAPAEAGAFDMVTIFFAYHDTTHLGVDRARMNKAVFAALKPGGFYVIADHSAKPEDGATVGKTLHRIGEAALRAEVEAAGFKLVASGDFLRHPEDKRDAPSSHNPTPVDEFVLKFQKP
jgi:predicted methyltransferase